MNADAETRANLSIMCRNVACRLNHLMVKEHNISTIAATGFAATTPRVIVVSLHCGTKVHCTLNNEPV